ncbi:MAG: YggS family pyridoxal phosphate-dependent enzyme [Polyangia bacterium]|nr:YggS family pyridoxal phosphate-dependent enzyme [Polyangia bacterium]
MSFGVEANLRQVRQDILAACAKAGRDPSEVTLVAVSKHQPTEAVLEALAAGQLDFGENYAQELRDKARELASGPRWHYIGPLQRNKAKYVVGTACLVHTLDSEKLLGALEERAAALGTGLEVLLQVNLVEEPQKSGASLGEVASLLDAFAGAPHVFCRGLMLMPPWDPDPEAARPLFAELRRLRDSLAATPRPNVSLTHLSMGMSHDFHVAIEEGATLVRVGTAIFGER